MSAILDSLLTLPPYSQFYLVFALTSRLFAWIDMYWSWTYFSTVQTLLPAHLCHIRPLAFFTCSGHYLSAFYICWPLIFGEAAPPMLAGLVYGVLFGITAGFWAFVYDPEWYSTPLAQRLKHPSVDHSKSLVYDGMFLTDWTNHGPLFLLFSKYAYDAGDAAFLSENWFLAPAWGFTWLIFIWFPFQLLGGDPLYEMLGRDKSFLQKSYVIGKLVVITEMGYMVGAMGGNTIFYEGCLKVTEVVTEFLTSSGLLGVVGEL